MSVGIEDAEDLIEDLRQALEVPAVMYRTVLTLIMINVILGFTLEKKY